MSLASCVAAVGLGGSPGRAQSANAQQVIATYPLSPAATDWLVKSVCVDATDRPVAVDPYYDCPTGTRRRKIDVGDPLPYHNVNQTGNLRSDSFPLVDTKGKALYFRTFDWAPFDRLDNNTDGYDVYALQDDWVSISATKDGASYGSTFFGANCALEGGWLSFPTQNFLRGGEARSVIAGIYWEHRAESFPGSCPGSFETTQTDWRLQPNVMFGDIINNSTKQMDTVISYHDYKTTPEFLANGHMEVFYFTQQYGLTKWESWVAAGPERSKPKKCAGPDQFAYRDVNFVIADCQDFSNVTLDPAPHIPEWPLPQANLLNHAHFDKLEGPDQLAGWSVSGSNGQSAPKFWRAKKSTATDDVVFNPTGVRFLELDCRNEARCGPLFQDIPVASFASGSYLYGVTARTNSADGPGRITVSISQLDTSGKSIWSDSFETDVAPYNGSHPNVAEEANSAYLSSGVFVKVASVALLGQARTIRFSITPRTSNRFDFVEAWLNRWPRQRW